MELSKSLEEAYNRQIMVEFEAAFTYQQLSITFTQRELPGFAGWMSAQAEEERGHAQRFIGFVLDRGGDVKLGALDAPQGEFERPIDAIERALTQEQQTSRAISDLYGQAVSEGDFASIPFLNWAIAEQVEEEDTVGAIAGRLRLAGDDPGALLMIDSELAARNSAE